MKKILLIFIFLLLFSACQSNEGNKTLPQNTQTTAEKFLEMKSEKDLEMIAYAIHSIAYGETNFNSVSDLSSNDLLEFYRASYFSNLLDYSAYKKYDDINYLYYVGEDEVINYIDLYFENNGFDAKKLKKIDDYEIYNEKTKEIICHTMGGGDYANLEILQKTDISNTQIALSLGYLPFDGADEQLPLAFATLIIEVSDDGLYKYVSLVQE